jgi:hypothetical protein
LLPATVDDTDAKAMSSLLVIAPAKGNPDYTDFICN